MKRAHVYLSIRIDGDDPPTEFRVFKPGRNTSTKGTVIFDDVAAKNVMRFYERHGVDIMIDLEHLAIDTESRAYDPDARGWARLELRDDGSLWAVDVRWTPEGEQRLREKRQRYISPAFNVDKKTGRVTDIFNFALVAVPATHQAPPLVAASRRETMKLSDKIKTFSSARRGRLRKLMDLPEEASLEEVVAALEEMPALEALEVIFEAMEDVIDEVADDPPGEDEPAAEEEALADEPEDEDEGAVMAASARLMRLTAKHSFASAVDEVEVWRQSHLRLTEREAALAKEREQLEAGERRELVATLVKLGAETPATAFDAKKKIVKRLTDEPLKELRERVKALSAGRGNKTPRPPVGGDAAGIHGLTEHQLRICKDTGADPETFARNLRKFNELQGN